MNIYDYFVDIKPIQGRRDKYSQNLYNWLQKIKKKGYPPPRLYVQIGCGPCRVDEYSSAKTQAAAIYIGFPDNSDLFGSHLSGVLCNGGSEPTFCYPGYSLPSRSIEITDTFWTEYLLSGKCAIDPEHSLYFDAERYIDGKQSRACKWCGQIEVAITEFKRVKNTVWIPDKNVCILSGGA